MQLRRPTRFVFGVGISNRCLFRWILWTARTLREASEAISLFSNPSFSKALIKICCAAFSCGAMITNTKALTLAGLEKEERRIGGVARWVSSGTLEYNWAGCTATSVWKWTPLKIIN